LAESLGGLISTIAYNGMHQVEKQEMSGGFYPIIQRVKVELMGKEVMRMIQ
jgi:hypothetical protein